MIAVISGKGGIGKSTLAAALGIQLAAQGKRVVLVDMSTGMRCLDMLFGLESRIGFDLGDVVNNGCGLDRAIVTDRQTGVSLIAASQFCGDDAYNERSLQIIMEVLCTQYDYVLLDTGSAMMNSFRQAVTMAPESILLTTPDNISLRNAERVMDIVRQAGRERPMLVICGLRREWVHEGLQYTPDTCAQVLDVPVFAAFGVEDAVRRASLERRPGLEGTEMAAGIANLAQRLENPEHQKLQWDAGEGIAAQEDTVAEKAIADFTEAGDIQAAVPLMPDELMTIEAIAQNVTQVMAAAELLSETLAKQEETARKLAEVESEHQNKKRSLLEWLRRPEA